MAHVDQSDLAYMYRRAKGFRRLSKRDRQKHIRKHRWIAWRDGAILREVLIVLHGAQCACCGRTSRLTIDHILPISKGGRTVIDNMQLLCRKHNVEKARHIMDFRPGVF